MPLWSSLFYLDSYCPKDQEKATRQKNYSVLFDELEKLKIFICGTVYGWERTIISTRRLCELGGHMETWNPYGFGHFSMLKHEFRACLVYIASSGTVRAA